MPQRYFLYYLAARIVLALITIYVFPDIWFWGFLLSYRRYLIIVSVSYFTYGYYINEEDKKFHYLRNSLLVFNIYLTLHVFFRPVLNIEPALFLLLGCIILGLRYISQLHMKIKRPFYLIGGIFSFLILISGIFYLYPEAPDIAGFQAQQQTQLILISPTSLPQRSAYIKLTHLTTNQQQDIFFQTGTQFFPLPETYQISYISTTPENQAQAFIILPNANLLQIFPQSTTLLQNEIIPEIWTFARAQAPRTGLIDDLNRINPEVSSTLPPILPETYEHITSFYRTHFQFYLAEQMGSTFLTNPTIQQINKSALTLLSKLFPGFFAQNLRNYYQFEYYFSLFSQQETIIDTKKYSISNTIDTKNTNLFQQLKNNIQLSTPNLNIF